MNTSNPRHSCEGRSPFCNEARVVGFAESRYGGKLPVAVKMDTCLRRYDREGKSILLCSYDAEGEIDTSVRV